MNSVRYVTIGEGGVSFPLWNPTGQYVDWHRILAPLCNVFITVDLLLVLQAYGAQAEPVAPPVSQQGMLFSLAYPRPLDFQERNITCCRLWLPSANLAAFAAAIRLMAEVS